MRAYDFTQANVCFLITHPCAIQSLNLLFLLMVAAVRNPFADMRTISTGMTLLLI